MSNKRRIIDVYGFADFLDERCSDLYIQDMNGKYSKEYVELCKDFYLHM